jgi:ribosomal protein S18 acetylase RimI-like enzyme
MSEQIEYFLNKASEAEIAEHLQSCQAGFVPPLGDRVDIRQYARKITSAATRFEAWTGGQLVGLVAAYCNDLEVRASFITSVSVMNSWTGHGIAKSLLTRCVEYARAQGFQELCLEVDARNSPAIRLYQKAGFLATAEPSPLEKMSLQLNPGRKA